jgi:hypothetical protein
MTTETLTFLEKVEQALPVNAQEVFDHAVNNVLRQVAANPELAGACRYRWDDPRAIAGACTVGHCIPDAFYDPNIEGFDVEELRDRVLLPYSLKPHVQLLEHLQSDHDCSASVGRNQKSAFRTAAFKDRAFRTAGFFGLSTANIIEI